jgi:hypothetical protein
MVKKKKKSRILKKKEANLNISKIQLGGHSKKMTLEEAIKHCLEVAKETDCKECSEEHKQLAKWLEELKQYKKMKFLNAEINRKITRLAKPRTKRKETVLTMKFSFDVTEDNENEAKDACRRFKHWMNDYFSQWNDSILQYFLYANKLAQDPDDAKYRLEVHLDKVVKDDSSTIDQRNFFDFHLENDKNQQDPSDGFNKMLDLRNNK